MSLNQLECGGYTEPTGSDTAQGDYDPPVCRVEVSGVSETWHRVTSPAYLIFESRRQMEEARDTGFDNVSMDLMDAVCETFRIEVFVLSSIRFVGYTTWADAMLSGDPVTHCCGD